MFDWKAMRWLVLLLWTGWRKKSEMEVSSVWEMHAMNGGVGQEYSFAVRSCLGASKRLCFFGRSVPSNPLFMLHLLKFWAYFEISTSFNYIAIIYLQKSCVLSFFFFLQFYWKRHCTALSTILCKKAVP